MLEDKKKNNALFDDSLLNELNGVNPGESDGQADASAEEKPRAEAPAEKRLDESTEQSEQPEKEKAAGVSEDANRANQKLFILRVLAVAVGVLGFVMLVCGLALHRLDEESRKMPEKEQMPEEYIEEFFSDEHFTPNIEDYIEPEA